MKNIFAEIIEIGVTEDFTIRLKLHDGKEQRINFEPILYGDLCEPLREKEFFNQVSIDKEVGTIVWPNGADFDLDMLYLWDEIKMEFIQQIKAIHA